MSLELSMRTTQDKTNLKQERKGRKKEKEEKRKRRVGRKCGGSETRESSKTARGVSTSGKWVVGEKKNFRNQRGKKGIYTLGKKQST